MNCEALTQIKNILIKATNSVKNIAENRINLVIYSKKVTHIKYTGDFQQFCNLFNRECTTTLHANIDYQKLTDTLNKIAKDLNKCI